MISILWRRLDLPGHEFCRLARIDDGWELAGVAVFAHDGRPCRLDYRVATDGAWRTRAARIEGYAAGRAVDLHVEVREGVWLLDGVASPAVAGCVDIDLGFTPSTNTLPIRRLALEVGRSAEVRAAWLPFPSLEFEVLPQVYGREEAGVYRYESNGGRFVRTLAVSEAGLVTSYPGLWEAEAGG